MKIAAITPCLYPDHLPISMLLESARAHKWRIDPYGVGQQYNGFGVTKGPMLLEALRKAESDGYTHVLYTDGSDSLFIANDRELMGKYQRLGAPPMLMSTEINCYPDSYLAPQYKIHTTPTYPNPFAYPNAGQWFGEVHHIVLALEKVMHVGGGDDQRWWLHSIATGAVNVQLDVWCDIFQNMNSPTLLNGKDSLVVRKGRVLNKITGTFPCFLHFSGGYSDPATGRQEVMKPWWDKLKP
jgi:hypothetical protein